MEEELEGLRREREEKLKAIAEKKKHVEELKKKRAERAEAQAARSKGEKKLSADLGRQVENLVAEILGSEKTGADGTSPEGPLKELRDEQGAAASSSKSLAFTTEYGQAAETIMPSEADVYNRFVQTDPVEFGTGDGKEPPKRGLLVKQRSAMQLAAERAKARAVQERSQTTAAGTVRKIDAVPEEDEEKAETQEMPEEEKERLQQLPDFKNFFDRTTLMVERVLGQQQWDSFADFKNASAGQQGDEEELIAHTEDYMEERWTQGRPVTDCRFSPRAHEYFLAAYGQKENPSLSDPDGCMLVWNVAMKSRPEMVFSSQSAVLTAHFHKFNPALYFGGTYSGGIVLWDSRAKAGPVQRTPLSGKGHSHPVAAMQQVGTQNATNLITASNEGRLCVWSLAMLVLPQETIDLKNEIKNQNRKDLAVMSLCFPENETNILYVGAEDGSVCQCHIHGSKVGVTEIYDGHEGPVTGLDMHPRGDSAQYGVDNVGDLAVTTSFDWSAKVWSVKQSTNPVLSLDNYEDYVYDARWHPSHPAVFSTVDGEGHVDLWNLNRNMESPAARLQHPTRKLALNKCSWSSDGKKLVTGDSDGMLSVYSVDKTVSQPGREDYLMFQERMRSFQPIQPRARTETMFAGRR